MKTFAISRILLGLLCLGLLFAAPLPGQSKSATTEAIQNIKDSTKKAASDTADYLDDSAITTKIKALFLDETELDSLDISVSTSDGVVTLTGKVNKLGQIPLAGEIASGVKGVKTVENKLTLK